MWKKIVFAIVAIGVLSAGIYLYFHLRKVKTPVSSAIKAVPADASLIFETRKTRNTWKKLTNANIMWADLLGTDFISRLNENGRLVDSLLELNAEAAQMLEDRPVLISLHETSKASFDFLYFYSLPDLTKQPVAEDFIKSTQSSNMPIQREHEGVTISTLRFKNKREFSYAFAKGVLIASFNSALVERSIAQLNSGASLQTDKHFSSILNSAGEKVDGNIYVNYKRLPGFLTQLVSPAHSAMAGSIGSFAAWSGVDVTIRPNEMMMSGFTAIDSAGSYLGIFAKQKPQDIKLTSIIPASTSNFIFYGISSFTAFREDHQRYLQQSKQDHSVPDSLLEAFSSSAERSLLSWIGNEMALVITEPLSADLTENSFAIFHSNDIEEAKRSVNSFADSVHSHLDIKPDTANIDGYTIRQLPLPGIIPHLLGPPFGSVKGSFYTSIGDYIIFGNSAAAIQQFIRSYLSEATLANDAYYSSFAEDNLSGDANLYIYSNIARSPNVYKAYTSEEQSREIEKHIDTYRRFQAAAIQFGSNSKQFYTNVFIKHNPIYKEESGSLWELPLDTTISSKPWLVKNHNTNGKEVFVQDDSNNIYLVSNTGKLLWSREMPEKIMSDVYQVDGLNNGKLQLLFNTPSHIYVIDRNGKDMKGFPVKLNSPATNGLALIDYENNHDYRILIACENKRLLNLKLSGALVEGWAFDKTAYHVTLPVQHVNAGGKDNLIAIDSKGKVYVLDRHGKERLTIKEHINKPVRSFYIEEGKDIAGTVILTCDSIGNIIRFGLNGNTETIKLKDFSSSPAFDYKDMDNDGIREFIFLDATGLTVYKQDKTLLFHHDFSETVITSRPMFFLFPDRKGWIGAASPAKNEVYLFDSSGQLRKGFPVKGSTLFCIGNMNDDDALYLVTASGKVLYAYGME